MSFYFRYKPATIFSGAIVKRPLIPITFEGNENKINIIGVLDTGSDISIIPREIAEVLGIEPKIENEISGIGGEKVKADQGKLTVVFGKGREEYAFEIPVLVPKNNWDQVIIGRMGFFEQFKITFNESEEKMIFKKVYDRDVYK